MKTTETSVKKILKLEIKIAEKKQRNKGEI